MKGQHNLKFFQDFLEQKKVNEMTQDISQVEDPVGSHHFTLVHLRLILT